MRSGEIYLKDHAPVMKTNFRWRLTKPPSQSFFLLLIAMCPAPLT